MHEDAGTDWAGAYFDHFERVLGAPTERQVFDAPPEHRTIQVLTYNNVFAGCRTFTTIGATHFVDELGGVAELFMAADSAWDHIPSLLGAIILIMAEQRIPLERGIAIRGIGKIVPGLAASTGKNAVYFTFPQGPPDEFAHVVEGGQAGHVYMPVLISEAEYAYFDERGHEALEDLFEQHEVDPFELSRPSCVAPG